MQSRLILDDEDPEVGLCMGYAIPVYKRRQLQQRRLDQLETFMVNFAPLTHWGLQDFLWNFTKVILKWNLWIGGWGTIGSGSARVHWQYHFDVNGATGFRTQICLFNT